MRQAQGCEKFLRDFLHHVLWGLHGSPAYHSFEETYDLHIVPLPEVEKGMGLSNHNSIQDVVHPMHGSYD